MLFGTLASEPASEATTSTHAPDRAVDLLPVGHDARTLRLTAASQQRGTTEVAPAALGG